MLISTNVSKHHHMTVFQLAIWVLCGGWISRVVVVTRGGGGGMHGICVICFIEEIIPTMHHATL